MKQKPFLKLHKEWMKAGRMPEGGLCSSIQFHSDMSFHVLGDFRPEYQEPNAEDINPTFWASGSNEASLYEYTPLRQTIMLFCAAINNEL
jgi:hypothetical protein